MNYSSCLQLLVLLLTVCHYHADGFECPESTGTFADPDSCRHFFSCNDFYPYRLFCAEGLLFDGAKKACVDRRGEVKCGPQPTTEAPVTTPDPLVASSCNATTCNYPECFCSSDGTRIPGDLDPKIIPQMIMITFDGGVNQLNYENYMDIFQENRTNPNGCPIRGTFFMSHEYTNYQLVEKFYSQGHEMAIGSITRRAGLEDATAADWSDEMAGMSSILNRFAAVNESRVIGMRAPHLTPGRNAQFESLMEDGFYWDSSLTVPPQAVPVWPYTLDHTYPHECKSATCPTHPFYGVWEVPMNSHYEDDLFSGGYCPYLDQCVLYFLSDKEVEMWLMKDFNRYYNGNKAPYMLTLTANWFNYPSLVKGLHRFIENTLQKPDIYYLTVTEMVSWLHTLATLDEITSDFPWICDKKPSTPPPCNNPNSCKLYLDPKSVGLGDSTGGTRYMVTCSECPRVFPWIGDPLGTGKKSTPKAT